MASAVGLLFAPRRAPPVSPLLPMEGTPVEALRGQQEALKAALAETRLALRQARQRERDLNSRGKKTWALTDPLARTMLIIYCLADCDPEPAIKFLHDAALKRRWPPRSQAELQRLVEDRFLQADKAQVAAWADVNSPADPGALAAALKYVQQWQLVVWTHPGV